MEREKVFEYIDRHYSEHLGKLQEFVKQPSISAENRGVRECAELVKSYLEDLVAETHDLWKPLDFGVCMDITMLVPTRP